LFDVPPGIDAPTLEELAYAHLARLFRRLAPVLAVQTKPPAQLPIRWSGEKATRRRCAALAASLPPALPTCS
jgi:hypothetical protein